MMYFHLCLRNICKHRINHCIRLSSTIPPRGHVPTPWYSPAEVPRDPTTPLPTQGKHFEYSPTHVSLKHYLNPPQPEKSKRLVEAISDLTPAEDFVQIPELFNSHCAEGHTRDEWNPKMSQFILGSRDDMYVIDLKETLARLRRAIKVIQGVGVKNGSVLFLSTRPLYSPITIHSSINAGQPFLVDKWVPGLLTNFTEVKAAVSNQAAELLADQNKASRFAKRKPRMARRILGLETLLAPPDILFIVNVKENSCAIKEAQAANVPIIAIVDTDCDPSDIAWPIPANDDHLSSVGIIMEKFSAALRESYEARGHTIDRSAIDFPLSPNEKAFRMPNEQLMLERLASQQVAASAEAKERELSSQREQE